MLVVDHTLGQQLPPERIRVSTRSEFFNFTAMMLSCLTNRAELIQPYHVQATFTIFFPKLHLTKICTCARNGSRQVDRVVGLSLNWHSGVGDKQEKKRV